MSLFSSADLFKHKCLDLGQYFSNWHTTEYQHHIDLDSISTIRAMVTRKYPGTTFIVGKNSYAKMTTWIIDHHMNVGKHKGPAVV